MQVKETLFANWKKTGRNRYESYMNIIYEIDMNHVWRSRNISANLLPFLFTVFTCTVSLKARAACSPCSVVCFDLFRINSFHPSPCAWTPDTWWEETKGRRLCTDPLNIWPCLGILCGIWYCCNAVWPQHGKKNADVSHIQRTASQLIHENQPLSKEPTKAFRDVDTSVGQWHP